MPYKLNLRRINMHKLNLAESISKTSDSSKNNNIFGSHKGELKKTKALIIMGLILIMSACFILYLYSRGVRWVHVSSGAEESPFMIIGASIFCIFLGLWFIVDYFKTPSFDIYENGLIIGKEEVLYNQIKEVSFINGSIAKFIIVTADRKIKYTSLGMTKSTQAVLQQISLFQFI